jgi:hypothetical protein
VAHVDDLQILVRGKEMSFKPRQVKIFAAEIGGEGK